MNSASGSPEVIRGLGLQTAKWNILRGLPFGSTANEFPLYNSSIKAIPADMLSAEANKLFSPNAELTLDEAYGILAGLDTKSNSALL